MDETPRVDDDRVRRWLTNLRRPDRLDEPALRELLRAHGRDTAGPSLPAGRAAAELLREKIEALRAPDGAPTSEALVHRVLETCFVDGAKGYQAAARLGLSERQLSRERSRAISLLRAELTAIPRRAAPAHVPSPQRLVPRPEPAARLGEALSAARRVHVTGAAGVGKTALLASWAAGEPRVFWHTFVPHLGEGLPSLLFELGEHLAPEDPCLAAYVRASVPSLDTGLASRIALAALRHEPRLFVLDDLDAGLLDAPTRSFLATVAQRLPSSRIVTVGRRPWGPDVPSVVVPALTPAEARALLALRGVGGDETLARRLWSWTRGNARLVDAAAAWLTSASPDATAALAEAARDGDAVVRTLTSLMWATRRAA